MKKKNKKVPTQTFDKNEIVDQQMVDLLVELANTIYWAAILKFNQREDLPAIGGLATIDPFKEPTMVARTQGWRSGLYRLEEFVKREIERRKEISEGSQK